MKKVETKGEWSLTDNGLDLFILKLEDSVEGPESLWANTQQLKELRDFLNSLELDGAAD
jgi:hypothetical protein